MNNTLTFLAILPFMIWGLIEWLTQRRDRNSELIDNAYESALEREAMRNRNCDAGD